MSRLADYSKFDNLDDSDDDAPAPAPPQQLDPQGIPEVSSRHPHEPRALWGSSPPSTLC